MLSNLKFRNKPNTEHRNGIVVKIAGIEKQNKDQSEREYDEKDIEGDTKAQEEKAKEETGQEEKKNPPKVVDYRNRTNVDRMHILRKINMGILPTDETIMEEEMNKPAVTEDIQLLPKEVPVQEEPVRPEPVAKKAPKKRVVIRKDIHIQIAEPISEARKESLIQKMPKPVNYDKIILRAPLYYMNNRRLYLQKINKFFETYKKQMAEMEKMEITCETRNKMDNLELFIHQKIVRDYLNIYTPYRGLLLYHGLGSGKTCTSIAIAEGMKTHKGIIVMTPASLKMNFFAELKKCGDHLYKKEQYWHRISTDGNPELATTMSELLHLPMDFIKRNHGVWFVDIHKRSNFGTLNPNEQQQIDDQLNTMIRAKYTDINYNGLNWGIINRLTNEQTVNPFDNKVVIIDEAHNFVSRIVNKINKPNSISFLLYNYLMSAENAKIVLLTGTPIINYPNEIGILFNMLRGFIKTWSMQLRVNTNVKVNRDTILEFFEKEGLNIYDYVEYTGNTLTITRNPYGFINTNSKDKIPRGRKVTAKISGGRKPGRKTKKVHVEKRRKITIHPEDTVIHLTDDPQEMDEIELDDDELKEAKETIDLYNEMYRADVHKGGDVSIDESIDKEDIDEMQGGTSLSNRQNTDFVTTATTLYALPTMMGGNAFKDYTGVKLDETGNMSDADFIRRVTDILRKNDIEVIAPSIQLTLNKALPDDSEEFISKFIESDEINRSNLPAFKRRILGLTSYFRSAQESLLPQYVPTDKGDIYHVVPCVMSNYQYGVYALIRKEEADKEKKQRLKKKMAKDKDNIFNIASSYRIFSRACCNFAFPKTPGRPMPNVGDKEISERELDALPTRKGEDEDVELEGEGEPEEGEAKEGDSDYAVRIQRAMTALKYDPSKPESENPLSEEGLAVYSPKFLHILANVQDPDYRGLHLLYSNFRTIEGIGILRLILEANGFVEFKLEKTSAGIWDVTEDSFPTESEMESEDIKPRFVLYTGTETAEEKEIIRNIYNSDWRLVPKNIIEKLEERTGNTIKNNFMGEVIKLLMITASGAEGINLKNTRYVHIVEPYWHMVRLEQVIGRARRICSHADLPPELRTIQVFLYVSVFSKEQQKDDKNIELRLRDVSKLDKKTPITTDESLYETSIIKDKIIRELLTSVKETAIDCSIYAEAHKNEHLVCYGFGKVESNQFASYPILEQDLGEKEDVQKQTVKTNKVKIGEKIYILNTQTNELYEPAEYERAKKTGADLVPIGRLIKGPGGYEIVSTDVNVRKPERLPLKTAILQKEVQVPSKETEVEVEVEAEKEKSKEIQENPVTEPIAENIDTDVVFVFSEKSTDKALPGKGPGEKIPKYKIAEFKELAEIPDWRKKLDTTWSVELELDGKTWASAEHYIQASKYKMHSYPLYELFAIESESDLSKDVEMAHAVGETGKFKGKVFKVPGIKKIQQDNEFDLDEVTYKINFVKFLKHADLKDVLQSTRSAGLYRNIRGKEPEVQNALMRVRQRLV